MKRIRRIVGILLGILLLIMPVTAYAEGDPNIDSGGGGFGGGTGQNCWNNEEGVRVTVVDALSGEPRSISMDISNKAITNIRLHFGEVSKTAYRSGVPLTPQSGGYHAYTPKYPLPRIISCAAGKASITAIKSYFTDAQILRQIASHVGMDYDVMIGGNYKLLVEPVAYVTLNGIRTAFTATEAALYDQRTGGDVSRKMPSLTHKNLPLSLFLERADLGYAAWTGSRDSRVSDEQIINFLGMGVVRFTDTPGNPPEFDPADYEYRTDTDVITSVYVRGGQSDPDHPVHVTFSILGRDYTVTNVYYPKDGQQLVWVKWHTPLTPQRVNIQVSSSGGTTVSKSTLIANINLLEDNPPPNPVADDRNDSYDKSLAILPSYAENTSAGWSVWRCQWHPKLVWKPRWVWKENWVWVDTGHTPGCPPNCQVKHGYYSDDGQYKDEGEYVDEGWWDFYLDYYSASLSADMKLSPDDKNPTANGDVMKSGYGVNVLVNARMSSTNYGAVTGAQNAISYFPEFYYKIYWRLLDMTSAGYRSEFQFKTNPYSTYGKRVHFSPIWMPDGEYKVYTYLFDAWTPTGELKMNLASQTQISGNLWSDWHIAPKNPD